MKASSIAASIILALSLTACNKQSDEEILAAVSAKLNQGSVTEASIQLKSMLQDSPENAKARRMLGEIEASKGAALPAIKELEMALQLNEPFDEIIPHLAPMLYLAGETERLSQLIAQTENKNSDAYAALLAYDGIAFLEANNVDKADLRLEEAKAAAPKSHFTKLLDAYVTFSLFSNAEKAKQQSETLIDRPIVGPDALFLLGQIGTVTNDSASMVKAYEGYLAKRGADIRGAIMLANAYVTNGNYSKAEKIISPLLKENSQQPFLNYLKSVIAFQSKDFGTAQLSADRAIQNGYSNTSVRVIAALSALRLDKKEQAFANFDAIKDQLPPDSELRQIHGSLAIELGYFDDFFSSINDKTNITDLDALILQNANRQLLRVGDYQRANTLLDSVQKQQLSSPRSLLARGMISLSLDDLSGIADLEAALALSPSSEDVNTALARAYLNTKEFTKALALAKAWQSTNAELPNGFLYEALIYEQQGKIDKAKEMHLKALEISPTNPVANHFLALNAYLADDLDTANAMLGRVFETSPLYPPSLRLEYNINLKHKGVDDAINTLVKAFETEPKNAIVAKMVAQSLFDNNKYEKAVTFLDSLDQETQNALQSNFWVLKGNSLFRLGKHKEAVQSAFLWRTTEPRSMLAHLRVITLTELVDGSKRAFELARESLNKFPQSEDLRVAVIDLATRLKEPSLARQTLNRMPEEFKHSALNDLLNGQILLEEEKAQEAVEVLSKAHTELNSDRTAWMLAKAHIVNNKPTEAYSVYGKYINPKSAHPDMLVQYAELAIRNNDNQKAYELYKLVLNKTPNNLRALNNSAYIAVELRHFNDALKYSSKALELAPNNFSVKNTRALALWKAGEFNQAFVLFKELLASQPRNKKLIRNYSEALRDSGDQAQADALLKLL